MTEFDKTKQNIGIDKLDDDVRKKLFNDFIAAGGKVDTPTKRQSLSIDREKQVQFVNKIESLKKSRTQASQNVPRRSPNFKQKTNRVSIVLKIKIACHLFFTKVTGINTLFFKDSFLSKLSNDYRIAFENLQKIHAYVFQLNEGVGKSIISKLDSEKPLWYELIESAAHLYEKEYFDNLLEDFQNKNITKNLSNYRDKMLYLMKKLCVLKPYENVILNCYLKALDYYVYYSGDKFKNSEHRSKVKYSLFLIFNKLYYQLYWLTVKYTNQDPKYDSLELYKLLSISDGDRPGSRGENSKQQASTASQSTSTAQGDKSDKSDETKNEKDKVKEKINELSAGIKLGLKLMSKINTNDIIAEFNHDKLFEGINDSNKNDKIFKIFILFAEFEKEYSFILTTSKIKYNVYYTSSGKIDYVKRLQDIYGLMKKPWDFFKELKAEQQNYDSTSQDKPMGNQQYMVQINRLKEIENNKNRIALSIKNSILDFLEKLNIILEEFQDDLQNDCKLISNPHEALVFEVRIEGQKKLSGVKVYEAINTIAAYVEAFMFRLSRSGDLYGLNTENTSKENVVDRVFSAEQENSEDSDLKENATQTNNFNLEENVNQTENFNLEENVNQTENSDLKLSQTSSSDSSIFNELDDLL